MDKETTEFFDFHNISLQTVMDAKGQSIYSLKDLMKENNILFAYNTTPCSNGHTIRSRAGHCIVCDTARIAYTKRSVQTGNVYIAGSLSKQFIKVGMSTEALEKRITKLNSRKVGNTNDWVVLKSVKCESANKHEFEIQSLLHKYRVDENNYSDSDSREIFRCSFHKANAIMDQYFSENEIPILESKSHLYNTEKYAFPNLIKSK